MDGLTVGAAAKATGWSARMLRYLEGARLVVPRRSAAGYRLYGLRELNQLRSLGQLRSRFGAELTDIAFAARLRREPRSAAPSTRGSQAPSRIRRLGRLGAAKARAALAA